MARRISLALSQSTLDALSHAAQLRGTTPQVVASRLLRTIVADNLVTAVLDDHAEVAAEERWREYET